MNILFVDDDRLSRVMLAHGLRQHDLIVTEAESAAQALELLDSGCFEILLTDLQMPVMDGRALAAEVRRLDLKPGMRMVAISGSILSTGEQNCLLDLFDAVVAKPVTANDLVTILMAVRSRAGLRGKAA